MSETSRVLLAGAGGIGCFVGARLSSVVGVEVGLLARGAQCQALRTNGVRLVDNGQPEESFDLPVLDSGCGDDLAKVGRYDWVIVCCKTQHTEALAAQLLPVVRGDARILSLQNGVDNEPLLAAAFQREVVGGLCIRFAAHLTAPGQVSVVGPPITMIGEYPQGVSDRVRQMVAWLNLGGMQAQTTEDIRKDLWRKLVINGAVNPVTALLGRDTGFVRDSHHALAVVREVMDEIAAAARVDGVDLSGDDLAQMWQVVKQIDAFKSSMQIDAERGSELEYAGLTEAVLRRVEVSGGSAPVTRTLERLLKALYPPQSGSEGDRV
ncbi:MAG: 2-dehydropantoate 2-reductase [Gammaproteobacteria bacterium]|nr:2-dehydropantoate 2-reductase [Gammaproteobacteria bacterium]